MGPKFLHEALVVVWKQTLVRLILFLGCGSFLTLLSGFYSRPGNPVFMDVVPTEVRELMFGFPLPIYASYAAWWGDFGVLDFSVTFVWLGALLDVIFYAFILWIGSRVVRIAKATKAQVTKSI